MTSQHEFKDDVDRFMDHLRKAINLRLEVDIPPFPLRKESDKMIENAEYMVYEMIDNAMEEGALYAQSRD